MAVVIVTSSWTNEVTGTLTRLLHDVTDDIQVMTPESYLKNSTERKYLIKIIVATETLLELIQNLRKQDVESLFQQRETEVVLIDDTAVDGSIDDTLPKIVKNWSAVKIFNADRIAQAVEIIRNEIIHNAEHSFSKRYLIHPQTVPQLFETDVMIVLGDDVNHSTEKVTVHFHGRPINATKKQANIWMFNIEDMPPGIKIFRIMADEDDLGPNKLSVLGIDHVAKQAVAKLRDSDAQHFLADLLCLNITDFDRDLVDILEGSSCMQLVEHLLKFGDDRGHRYPTILHLCARYGLKWTLEWCRKKTSCKSKFSIKDINGKTAEQVAKEKLPDDTFYESFQDDGNDFEDSQRTGSRDSGRSSSGSVGTQSPYRKNTQRKRLPSDPVALLTKSESTRPFDFSTRVERPYEEISDRDLASTVYSEPWEESQLAADIQTLTAHPEEVNETNTRHSATLPSTTEDTKF